MLPPGPSVLALPVDLARCVHCPSFPSRSRMLDFLLQPQIDQSVRGNPFCVPANGFSPTDPFDRVVRTLQVRAPRRISPSSSSSKNHLSRAHPRTRRFPRTTALWKLNFYLLSYLSGERTYVKNLVCGELLKGRLRHRSYGYRFAKGVEDFYRVTYLSAICWMYLHNGC